MNRSRLLLSLCSGLALLATGCLEDNPNAAAGKEDTGFLMLDGGGPMSHMDMPPAPKLDTGGTSTGKKVKGRFCHSVKSQNGQAISLTLRVESVSMSATTGSCSACTDIPTGKVTLRVYSGSQYLGGASSQVNEQNEYIYLLTYPSGSKYAQLSKEELDPKKGETCDKYQPKL